jgi:zinc transport system substrate-binding protein
MLAAMLGHALAAAPSVIEEPVIEEPIPIAVSVPPQAYFVERIGGDRVRTNIMIPPGASHETYAPSPRQMVEASRARVYVRVGHPQFLFERQYIEPFLREHPRIAVVNMSQGMEFLDLPEHAHEGAVAPAGERSGGERSDPHVWLAPYTVKIAAGNIGRELARLDPTHAAEYQANLARFLADIDALDRDITRLLSGIGQRRFLVYHPAWGYFAKQYGLEQAAIEAEGKEPSPVRLMALVRWAREQDIHAVFVQKGFSTKGAEAIAREIGGEVIEIDPLARDWIANMREVAAVLHKVLAGERSHA